jgi:hypothetical protein
MTPDELQRALWALDITQQKMARLFGHDERTMRRWVAGESAIPSTVAILVRLLVADKISPADVDAVRDVQGTAA